MRSLIALALAACALAAPQRIVSTTPAITETLFALGLGDRVAGVTDYCHYPPEARNKPKIGGYLRPSVESIVALRPDLVVVERSPVNLNSQLARLSIATVEVELRTLGELFSAIDKIAAAAGVPDRGASLRGSLERQLDQIRAAVKPYSRPTLMFIVGRTPGTLTNLVAAGGGSYLTELIAIGGGVNVFADAPASYPKVSMEEVLARNPDVIVDLANMGGQLGATEAQKREVLELWRKYPVKAAQQARVFAVDSDIFVVPGPRVVEAARAFAKMLHPEAKW